MERSSEACLTSVVWLWQVETHKSRHACNTDQTDRWRTLSKNFQRPFGSMFSERPVKLGELCHSRFSRQGSPEHISRLQPEQPHPGRAAKTLGGRWMCFQSLQIPVAKVVGGKPWTSQDVQEVRSSLISSANLLHTFTDSRRRSVSARVSLTCSQPTWHQDCSRRSAPSELVQTYRGALWTSVQVCLDGNQRLNSALALSGFAAQSGVTVYSDE